jgi:DNA-binding Lrp family transcriptional regulator
MITKEEYTDHKFQLTDKDRKVLELLQENARETTAALARKLGVSRATVQERISRLEKANVIEGYSVRLNLGVILHTVNALVMVQGDNKSYNQTLKVMRAMSAVQSIYSLSGQWDYALYIANDTLEGLNDTLIKINNIQGVVSTVSHIILENQLDRRFPI